MDKRIAIQLLLAVVAALVFVLVIRHSTDEPPKLNDSADAYRAWYSLEFEKAENICNKQLKAAPNDPILLSIAARASAQLNHVELVRGYFAELPPDLDDPDPDVPRGFAEAAIKLAELGHLDTSEAIFRWSLEFGPWEFETQRDFARLLSATGRRPEAHEHFVYSIRGEPAEFVDLVAASAPQLKIQDYDNLTFGGSKVDSQQPSVELGLGMLSYLEGSVQNAEELFRQAIEHDVTLLASHAMLGRLLVEGARWDELFVWYRALPEAAGTNSQVWYVQGCWAEHLEQPKVAVRCFAEAVRRDPMDADANKRLALVLAETTGEEEYVPQFQGQAERLYELRELAAASYAANASAEGEKNPDPLRLK